MMTAQIHFKNKLGEQLSVEVVVSEKKAEKNGGC